jgi:hypothetical protein
MRGRVNRTRSIPRGRKTFHRLCKFPLVSHVCACALFRRRLRQGARGGSKSIPSPTGLAPGFGSHDSLSRCAGSGGGRASLCQAGLAARTARQRCSGAAEDPKSELGRTDYDNAPRGRCSRVTRTVEWQLCFRQRSTNEPARAGGRGAQGWALGSRHGDPLKG